jgi:hypothetical protein
MSATPRLSLPFLSAGQAQKEIAHNAALQTLDCLVAGSVEEPSTATAPISPVLGACYIVDPSATGAWTGMSHCVASWTSGGWEFIQPVEGMSFYVQSTSTWKVFRSGSWELGIIRGDALILAGQQVVGPRLAAVASAVGGTTVDAEARAVLDAVLNALRQHGLIAA